MLRLERAFLFDSSQRNTANVNGLNRQEAVQEVNINVFLITLIDFTVHDTSLWNLNLVECLDRYEYVVASMNFKFIRLSII